MPWHSPESNCLNLIRNRCSEITVIKWPPWKMNARWTLPFCCKRSNHGNTVLSVLLGLYGMKVKVKVESEHKIMHFIFILHDNWYISWGVTTQTWLRYAKHHMSANIYQDSRISLLHDSLRTKYSMTAYYKFSINHEFAETFISRMRNFQVSGINTS